MSTETAANTTFLSLGIMPELDEVLESISITKPTPIQEKAIPVCLQGNDLIACARTGTGKTLAFALPMMSRLIDNEGSTALILVPTRELAMQVADSLRPLMNQLKIFAPCLLIGGTSFDQQVRTLRRKPFVIVATPGRLNDHLQQKTADLSSVKTLVLDEADRMLDMGFLPQIKQILRFVPKERQTLLFSATFDPALEKFTKDLMKNPQRVNADPPSTHAVTITQSMLEVHSNNKQDQLLEEINKHEGTVLVFARTKRRTDKVAKFLSTYGVAVDSIHGDRSQAQRKRALDAFRAEKIRVLVATDVAARGLDISHVNLVINFDLPETREDYVHRIGRTGRAEREGIALSFVAPEEHKHWAYVSQTKPSPAVGGRKPSLARPRNQARPDRSRHQERPRFEAREETRRERPAHEARREGRPDRLRFRHERALDAPREGRSQRFDHPSDRRRNSRGTPGTRSRPVNRWSRDRQQSAR